MECEQYTHMYTNPIQSMTTLNLLSAQIFLPDCRLYHSMLDSLTGVVLFMGLGPPELALLLAIFVLLFGASKIPEVARSSGEAMGEFKKGREEMEKEIQEQKAKDSENVSDDTSRQEMSDEDPETEVALSDNK